jgi:hypothetical protein
MGAVGRNGGRFLRRSVSRETSARRTCRFGGAENSGGAVLRRNVSRETSARAGAGDRRLAILQNNPMNEKIIQ